MTFVIYRVLLTKIFAVVGMNEKIKYITFRIWKEQIAARFKSALPFVFRHPGKYYILNINGRRFVFREISMWNAFYKL